MANKGITIAISGTYNGRALEKAQQDLEKMRLNAVSAAGGASGALVDLGSEIANVGGEIHNVGYKMQQFGNACTTYITLPITAAALACGSAAIEIDDALTDVKKTVDGTDDDFAELKKAAIEFSKTSPVKASTILEIESLGAQLGYSRDELTDFATVVSGLDISTDMDAETAATELAQFANITKMASSDTSKYGSTIVALGNKTATTESKISAMAQRLAAAGSQAGMSEADILGLAASMSSMGLEAEGGGSAVSTIINQIGKDVAKNGKNLKTWAEAAGMSADEFAKAWKDDPVDALADVLAGLNNASEAGSNMSLMLEELGISSIRQTDAMSRLAGNSELVTDAIRLANVAWEEDIALTDEVNNRNESMSSKLSILENRVTAVAETVGTPLVNALLDVVDSADPLIQAVADAAQAFAEMDAEDQTMILGLVGAAAAFGPVTSAAGSLLQGVGDLVVGVGGGIQKLGLLGSELGTVGFAFESVTGGAATFDEGLTFVKENTTLLSGAAGVLESALNLLPFAAVAAAAAILVTTLADVIGRMQTLDEATNGLETAMDAASVSFDGFTTASENVKRSTDDVISSADKCIEKQAKLAEEARSVWSEYGSTASQVEYYSGKIEELANKSNLTKREQVELKNAVKKFNELTGSSIEVIDAENGKLSESVKAIKATTEAYKERAKMQAAAELYNDVLKQQMENEQELQEVTEELERVNEEYAKNQQMGWVPGMISCNVESVKLKERQDELKAAIESADKTLDQYLDLMEGSTPKFETLQDAFEETGITIEDFGFTSREQFDKLSESFDGSLESILESCNQQGLKIPDKLADAINKASSSATSAAKSLGEDVDDGLAQGIKNHASNPKDELGKIADNIINNFKNTLQIQSPSKVMETMGKYVDEGLANGIKNNKGLAKTAAEELAKAGKNGLDAIKNDFKTAGGAAGEKYNAGVYGERNTAYTAGKSVANYAKSGIESVSAKKAGEDFTTGFKNGMGSVSLWDAAYNVGCSALNAVKSALGIASPSKEAMKVGEWFGEGAIIGMRNTEQGIAEEAQRMSDAMTLNPYMDADYTGAYGTYGGAQAASNRQFNFNINVNVSAADAQQATQVGRSLGDELYLEFVRRERAYA